MPVSNNYSFTLRRGIWPDAGEPMPFRQISASDCKAMLSCGGLLVENQYDFDCKEETSACLLSRTVSEEWKKIGNAA